MDIFTLLLLILIKNSYCVPTWLIKNGDETAPFDVNPCDKKAFVKDFVKTGRVLTSNIYKVLENCPSLNEKEFSAHLSVIYAEDHQGKTVILIDAAELKPSSYWGYVLQIKSELSTSTYYFNFINQTERIQQLFYYHLGFNYNITLTPLPHGNTLKITTQAPNLCELGVLNEIYYKIRRKETFFDNCSPPGYRARKRIAKYICQLYPKRWNKRLRVVRRFLHERKCEFLLKLPSSPSSSSSSSSSA